MNVYAYRFMLHQKFLMWHKLLKCCLTLHIHRHEGIMSINIMLVR